MDPAYAPDLIEILSARASGASDKPKRQRTRLALLAATAIELQEHGYEELTIDGIVKQAGLARGTFYLYFQNRSDAAAAVRRSFTATLRKFRPRGSRKLSAWDAIYRVNRFYVAFYARNAGLLAGNGALFHDRPDLLNNRDAINHRWAQILLRDLSHRDGASWFFEQSEERALLALRFVILMADEALRQTFIQPPPYIKALARTEEDVAEVLSTLWYRCLYGNEPDR